MIFGQLKVFQVISMIFGFKQSFLIGQLASDDPAAYPKVAAWKSEGDGSDCCSWDVIECNKDTGHVLGLNLGGSCLYDSINFSSAFFGLVHLQELDLFDDDFNYSKIPSGVVQLLSLRSLNHPSSRCSGQIPLELLALSKLVVLGSLTKSIEAPVTQLGFRCRGEKHFLVIIQNAFGKLVVAFLVNGDFAYQFGGLCREVKAITLGRFIFGVSVWDGWT